MTTEINMVFTEGTIVDDSFKFYRIVDNYYYMLVENKSENAILDAERAKDRRSEINRNEGKTPLSKQSSNSSAPGALTLQSPRHSNSGVLPDLLPPHTPPQSRSPPTPQRPQDKTTSDEYRQAVMNTPAMRHERSFSAFGFGAGGSTISSIASQQSRRGSQINVNVTPSQTETEGDTPEIRKYKKKFSSDILCAALWGVNLLIGTENGLMLLDRSVYTLISRRRFQQMEVLEGQNILVTISGRKNKIRVYYLTWLKSKIFKNEGSFSDLSYKPLLVDLTVEESQRLKVLYGSNHGFHCIDVDTTSAYDLYIPSHISFSDLKIIIHMQVPITPHTIVILPNTDGMQLLLCYNNEGVYVDSNGRITYIGTGQIMGWGNKAIEIRAAETGHLDGVFMHKKAQKLKFLCERNEKVFFSSMRSGSSCQIYFMTLSKPGLANW
ncbi:hypothetical protein KUTeg_012732 [Tegillarca granosa]|uniref:non-specific serine/threonine protein kinase n=1 Tax=Tegillarca granosa TaxID=220873 RepID=A0ABQ9F0F2_TEGGR|nr:hypothetical protein KUTeg_012732 [Tegillarca granosa]